VTNLLANSVELTNMLGVMTNSYKLYDKSVVYGVGPRHSCGCTHPRFRTRTPAAAESVKRAKQVEEIGYAIHPRFLDQLSEGQLEKEMVLKSLSAYKPNQTVFEINKKPTDPTSIMMLEKRSVHPLTPCSPLQPLVAPSNSLLRLPFLPLCLLTLPVSELRMRCIVMTPRHAARSYWSKRTGCATARLVPSSVHLA